MVDSDILKKFRYPELLVKEYNNWVILCRFNHVTLGSLVLMCKDNVDEFHKISKESFDELPQIITEIEVKIKELFQNEKINYLMLMMVDAVVHFHIIPRYSSDRYFEGFVFKDFSWPKKTDIDLVNKIDEDLLFKITLKLNNYFNNKDE
ncbi:MAG: HIT domain-containing protein [Candidatus Staskawiczbacteria bacterium]|jgi:diadenosine tetraphosphate (Ap4A) HIT family hydrolase